MFNLGFDVAGNHRARAFSANRHHHRVAINQCRGDKARPALVINHRIKKALFIKNRHGVITARAIITINKGKNSIVAVICCHLAVMDGDLALIRPCF